MQFLKDELKHYPEARLINLCKNYFQDAYCTGHMIPNTTRAGAYLDTELKKTEWKDTMLWQPLAIHHDYYRLNILLSHNGVMPRRNELLEGMIKRVLLTRKSDIESREKSGAKFLELSKYHITTRTI